MGMSVGRNTSARTRLLPRSLCSSNTAMSTDTIEPNTTQPSVYATVFLSDFQKTASPAISRKLSIPT
jgi:hypothetical protein